MDTQVWALIPIVAIVGVFSYIIVRAVTQARVRELEVRERIAMIERGLVPPPEKDPLAFDRAMNSYDRYRERHDRWSHRSPRRYRSGGVTMIGIGLGMILLIGVAGGEMNQALGVGGFLVIMGLAFFINSWLAGAGPDATHSPAQPFQPPPPQTPGGARQPSSVNEPPR
jgi:hypothetical protein